MRISDFPAMGGRPAHGFPVPSLAGIQRRQFMAAEARRNRHWTRKLVDKAWLTRLIFLAALMVAAVIPVGLARDTTTLAPGKSTDGLAWPASFEGRALVQLPLSPVEQRFAARFPGRIGRFSDGSRNIILRVVDQPTRLLHPAADCFRGIGYHVDETRVVQRADGTAWSCFAAERDGTRRTVCERIYDRDGGGWTDVSAWYWAAMLGRTQGPWWAVTVANER